jgi:tRNA U34 5-methylaminomethyl-2-thiouridine-forming methyltransferase MnmC
MKPKIFITADDSKTLFSPAFGEHYHSVNGAFIESQHIFIQLGFLSVSKPEISILEIGYGTGLNAIFTFLENYEKKAIVNYHAIEKYPIDNKTFRELNYQSKLKLSDGQINLFVDNWDENLSVDNNFYLFKQQVDFEDFIPQKSYDLIYFDAFSPDVQPEMWSLKNIEKILTCLSTGGVFVTYSSRGDLKRNLRSCGMDVKRFPGPPGKRHVLRATKH